MGPGNLIMGRSRRQQRREAVDELLWYPDPVGVAAFDGMLISAVWVAAGWVVEVGLSRAVAVPVAALATGWLVWCCIEGILDWVEYRRVHRERWAAEHAGSGCYLWEPKGWLR